MNKVIEIELDRSNSDYYELYGSLYAAALLHENGAFEELRWIMYGTCMRVESTVIAILKHFELRDYYFCDGAQYREIEVVDGKPIFRYASYFTNDCNSYHDNPISLSVRILEDRLVFSVSVDLPSYMVPLPEPVEDFVLHGVLEMKHHEDCPFEPCDDAKRRFAV